jgi:hypothetical protein
VLLRILYFVEPSSKYLNYSVIQCFILAIEIPFVYKLCCIMRDSPVLDLLWLLSSFWHTSVQVSLKSLLSTILPLVISRDVLFIFLRSECYISPENVFDIPSLFFLLQHNNLHRPTPKNLSFVEHEIRVTADI